MRFKTVDGSLVTVGKVVDPFGPPHPIAAVFVVVHDDGRATTLTIQTNCLRMVLEPADAAAEEWLKMLESQHPFNLKQEVGEVVFRQPVLRVIDPNDPSTRKR